MRSTLRASLGGAACVLALAACSPSTSDNDSGTPTNDSAPLTDSGPVVLACPVSSSTVMIPDDTNQTAPCCYRASQASNEMMPELRLRYLHLTHPTGSALVTSIVASVLNGSLTNETFNWLIRGTAGAGDGPVMIETGFGTRNTDGTYSFSTMSRYAPVTLTGTITGETVTTQPDDGTLVVPVFDPTGTILQVELSLHNVEVVTSTFSESRSCIGTYAGRNMFTTAATLSGYLTIADTRGSMINVDPIHAELCTLVASSSLADPTSGPYCAQPQAMWTVQPDSICPATGQCMLDPGDGSVCAHDGSGAMPCNAWQLVSDFAAVGVDITD